MTMLIQPIDLEQKAHEEAKRWLKKELAGIGVAWNIFLPPKLPILPYHAIKIRSLPPSIFHFEVTPGIQNVIKQDAQEQDLSLFIYGVASQFNSCESINRTLPLLGKAFIAYQNNPTQGPQAQLSLGSNYVESMNKAAHIGLNGLCYVLNNTTLSAVQNGYFTPLSSHVDEVIDQLKEQGHLIEYSVIAGPLENSSKRIYQLLTAAPAFGSFTLEPLSLEKENEVQFLCALYGYRAQFHQVIELARSDLKRPIRFKPTTVGLGEFGNDPEIVALAFYQAASEVKEELTDYNVQVILQVYKESESAKEMARKLRLEPF